MRTRSLAPLAVIATLAALSSTAAARPRPHGHPINAYKSLGLGVMLGEPSGLNGKYFVEPSRAIDFGLGGITLYRGRSGLNLYADYLLHPVVLMSTDLFELPLYVGVGGHLLDFRDNANNARAVAFGVRTPVGIAFDFNKIPLDAFIEVAFVFDFFVDYTDDYGPDVNFSVGARYWFD